MNKIQKILLFSVWLFLLIACETGTKKEVEIEISHNQYLLLENFWTLIVFKSNLVGLGGLYFYQSLEHKEQNIKYFLKMYTNHLYVFKYSVILRYSVQFVCFEPFFQTVFKMKA